MTQIELSQLAHLWEQLGKMDTIEREGETVINDPFLHFKAYTPVLHIWLWFESQHDHFSVASQLYGIALANS